MRTITNNLPLIFIIVGITIILIASFSKSKNKKRTRYRNNSDRYSNNSNYNRNYSNSYNSNQNKSVRPFGEPLITETTALSKVSNAQYFKRPLMNRSEYKLFRKLEKHLEKFYKGQIVRLFSQVAMGEFLGSENDEAFRLVNAKRVDFVIVDSSGEAVIVIEYQGQFSVLLLPVKRFSPGLTIYFSEAEGEVIVDMLGTRLPMQEIKPDALEKLIRIIKL